jgi:hypothetical protein
MGFETAWKQAQAEYACEHNETDVRRLIASNGVVHFRRQCLRCGTATETVRKASLSPGKRVAVPEFDEQLRDRWDATKRERAAELHEEQVAKEKEEWEEGRRREKEEWDEWYAEYLQSPEWAHRRRLAMQRAAGMCEGCGVRRATQVHHTTYEHAGNELLFELRAVCRTCHEVIHGINEVSQRLQSTRR